MQLKSFCAIIGLLLCLAPAAVKSAQSLASSELRFEVSVKPELKGSPKAGRLFVILSRIENPEPRFMVSENGPDAPVVVARDVTSLSPENTVVLDETSFVFPIRKLTELPSGDYFVQALFDCNPDLRVLNAPGSLHSEPRQIRLDPKHPAMVKLELARQVPQERLPAETDLVKFVKMESRLLSEFHGRPMFLRAGVVLPRNFEKESPRKYPLWVRIGGLDVRYTSVTRLMAPDSEFTKMWLADETPRMVLLQLDGAGPNGDPYQVNSANNGPYGDAVVKELIPFIEEKFRGVGEPRARFLSGTSTGGWVSLALQVFYPDFFNGTWSASPDPVDFRAFQLVNIYKDENAYTNSYGNERPSERDTKGDVVMTMRREVAVENLLGRANQYPSSGGQWGAWCATFSPRGTNGLPKPLWDPETGKMDRAVAEEWKKYDLRLTMERNWKTLGPKLRGKLRIGMGDADQFFLNNSLHLLEHFLDEADPPFDGKIAYGPGKGHGWFDISLEEMMQEMARRASSESKSP